MLGWLRALPDELIRTRPVLSVDYAYALLESGEPEAAESRLRDAEGWLDTTADMGKRVPSADKSRIYPFKFKAPPLYLSFVV